MVDENYSKYLGELDKRLGKSSGEFISRYKEKLERELHPNSKEATQVPYSRVYKQFRAEELGGMHSFYESLCNVSERMLRPSVKGEQYEKLSKEIHLTHLNTTPEGVIALSQLLAILAAVIGGVVGALLVNIFIMISAVMLSVVLFFILPTVPGQMLLRWQAKAADQLVLAVLYLIIYMKREPNIERAIRFVASQISPPLSLDFIRVLWNFESGKYSTVTESLDEYITVWKDKEDDFIESVHLVESSLLEPDEKKADALLEKAVQVILDGTQDHMIHYAHSLQGPVETLHMLGIVLPVLGMVMLPMVSMIMGMDPLVLLLLYDIGLPIGVFLIARNILAMRPGGIVNRNKDIYTYQKRKSLVLAKAAGIGVFIACAIPLTLYIQQGIILGAGWSGFKFDTTLLHLSVLLISGLGLGLGVYYWMSIKGVIKLKHDVAKIEEQFSSATFQLGSRIEEDVPTELAFATVAKGTSGTETSKLFEVIDFNLRSRGMDLKDAVFDTKVGAAYIYPSPTIRSILKLVVDSAKKSPSVVADALMTISRYLSNMHKISERLRDLLADTIASMQMQASFFIALISAIVISLSVLISQVLSRFEDVYKQFENVATSDVNIASASGLGSLLDAEKAIPLYQLQIMVGIYVITVVIILSYLLSNIINGSDEIEARWAIAKNLFISTSIYAAVTFIASAFFSELAFSITKAIV